MSSRSRLPQQGAAALGPVHFVVIAVRAGGQGLLAAGHSSMARISRSSSVMRPSAWALEAASSTRDPKDSRLAFEREARCWPWIRHVVQQAALVGQFPSSISLDLSLEQKRCCAIDALRSGRRSGRRALRAAPYSASALVAADLEQTDLPPSFTEAISAVALGDKVGGRKATPGPSRFGLHAYRGGPSTRRAGPRRR